MTKNLKILLISPPSVNSLESPETCKIEKQEGAYPPLGLLYIASYLLKNTEHSVEVIDSQIDNLMYEDIKKEIQRKEPNLVGITATSFTIPDAILTAKVVKNVSEEIHVSLGGPHVQIYPEETLQIQEIDSVIIGDGEITFAELANRLAANKSLNRVKGLIFKKNSGRIVYNIPRLYEDNLDNLPFPARNLLQIKKYSLNISKRKVITSMIGSRGCPYSCNFCFKSTNFRYRSPKNLVDEMEECISLGIEDIQFYDETFTFNNKRTHEICDEIINRKLDVDWGIRTRIDLVDKKLIEKLRKAGCIRINYGVESATPRILKEIGKNSNLQEIKEIFKITKDECIDAIAYFMIGFPNETKEEMLNTINFAIKLDPDYCILSVLTPYPNTRLYQDLLKKEVYKEDYWRKFALNPLLNFTPKTCNIYLNREQLLDLLKYAYKRFYFRPKYVFERLRKMKSIHEFKNHLKTAYEIFTMS